jgi:hypothetical protein
MTERIAACRFVLVVALLSSFSLNTGAHDEHDPPLLGAIFPQLSRAGDSIVFSYQGAIWRIPRTGGVMVRLTEKEGFDCRPAWSPDGQRIAFIRGRTAFAGPVRLIESEDGSEIALPRQVGARDKLSFSPDGTRLLSVFNREGGRYALCWFDLETGEFGRELQADVWGLRYALSGDGKSIALATTQDIRGEQGGNNGPQCDLWTMPAEGGDAKKVAQFPGRVYDVSWSADDTSLLVVSNVGGVHNDLWQVPLDDPLRGSQKLTFGQADEDVPSTDVQGRWLLYTDNRRGPTALVTRDLLRLHDSVVTVSRRDYRLSTGLLSLEIRDADTDKLVTARISIRAQDGKYHAPPAALYRMLGPDVHFYCEGETQIDLPAGRYLLTAARGPEYPVTRREFNITPAGGVHETLELPRWTNQRKKNWYSGESHIHANYGYGEWYNSPRTMLAQSAGEDLIVSNFMVANSEADGVFDREYFRGSPDPLSTDQTILYWNEEFRSTIWGHLTLLNLRQLVEPIFTGFAHTTNPHDHPTNADIADHTHDQAGHVNYTHPAHNVKDPYLSAYSAKALPLDVALGKVDSIDVMGSNHVATVPLWYRLLNCGFRVPASAGTDCFLNRVRSRLPGQARVFVHVEGEFTYQRWIDALKAGRTFVTNGPMFEFTVDEQMAGSSIELDQPRALRVQGRVTSQYPLKLVEIVSIGEVVSAVELEEPSLDVALDKEVAMTRSGWIAIRASGPPHPDQPGGSVFGHTSPVYVQVQDRPIQARSDAEYFVAWIDRLRVDVRRRNRIPGRHQVHVESQIAEARAVFNELLETAMPETPPADPASP